MNYRHAFHAGNFADVVKHAVFVRVLVHLAEKPAAFRVIDTHAGAGRYALDGPEASRSDEWREGIGRLRHARLAPAAAALLVPYLDVIARENPGARLTAYPGSPAIAQALLRRHDHLIACELEPNAARALAATLARDVRAKAVAIDGWTALNAYVPPKERRGVVLIDPAFEQPDEFGRLAESLAAAHRKWPNGVFMLWYPIKRRAEPEALARQIKRLAIAKSLRVELIVAPPTSERLAGCGLMLVNPPWRLEGELAILLPALAGVLAREGKGAFRLDWLVGEK